MGRHEKEKMRGSFGRLMTPGDCELWTMSGLLYLRPTKQTEHMLESPSGTGTVRCRYGGCSGLWRGVRCMATWSYRVLFISGGYKLTCTHAKVDRENI